MERIKLQWIKVLAQEEESPFDEIKEMKQVNQGLYYSDNLKFLMIVVRSIENKPMGGFMVNQRRFEEEREFLKYYCQGDESQKMWAYGLIPLAMVSRDIHELESMLYQYLLLLKAPIQKYADWLLHAYDFFYSMEIQTREKVADEIKQRLIHFDLAAYHQDITKLDRIKFEQSRIDMIANFDKLKYHLLIPQWEDAFSATNHDMKNESPLMLYLSRLYDYLAKLKKGFIVTCIDEQSKTKFFHLKSGSTINHHLLGKMTILYNNQKSPRRVIVQSPYGCFKFRSGDKQ